MNITTKFSTLKLLFFSFSSCLTIERSIVFRTMDRQCESFSQIFSSATGLDKRFIFQNTWTSSSISENSEIFKKYFFFQSSKFQNFHKILKFQKFQKISKFQKFQIYNAKYWQKMRDFSGLYHSTMSLMSFGIIEYL